MNHTQTLRFCSSSFGTSLFELWPSNQIILDAKCTENTFIFHNPFNGLFFIGGFCGTLFTKRSQRCCRFRLASAKLERCANKCGIFKNKQCEKFLSEKNGFYLLFSFFSNSGREKQKTNKKLEEFSFTPRK